MSIKLTKAQTKSLASGVRRPKYKPREIRTVKNFFNNHEMWKTVGCLAKAWHQQYKTLKLVQMSNRNTEEIINHESPAFAKHLLCEVVGFKNRFYYENFIK